MAEDYLNIKMPERDINAVSSLGLAHVGDCVYELMVRSMLVSGGKLTNQGLHRETVRYVSATAQAAAAERILPSLTGEELEVYRRGRNAHVNSVPKNASLEQYHAATGLECLFGWLYLRAQHDRLNRLFAEIMEIG